ncbi:AlpA family phage regulatory protein [Escherichia coli]|nr:AlpA family phage regulatory protein [Escherichia coli]
MKPGLFALEAFLASCPRRLKSRKNRQEVKKLIHIKADSTLQSMINAGEFPQGFRVGLRRRGWYEEDVIAWMKEREQEARGTTA